MSNELWTKTLSRIEQNSNALQAVLKDGQFESLIKIAESLITGGVILADEVGLGKTFTALALMETVAQVGGTVGIVVPPGLMFQWESEVKKFRKLLSNQGDSNSSQSSFNIRTLRNYYNFVNHADFNNDQRRLEPLIISKERPVLLLSHNFGPPLVRINSKIKAFHLPTLYYGAKKEKEGGNTNEVRYWKQWTGPNFEGPTSIDNLCKYLSSINISWDKKDLDYLSNEKNRISRYDIGEDRRNRITSSFSGQGTGYEIQAKLIGYGIGKLDLLIVDEAHKSKGDQDNSTVLIRLLQKVINPMRDSTTRILGMTATPVELDSSQWNSLLERVGISEVDRDEKIKVIQSFSQKLHEGKINPDNRSSLENLIRESQNFEQTLNKIVSRRRKHQIKSFQELVTDSKKRETSHPNRRLNEIKICFDELSPNWKYSVLAYEGIAKAARGLPDVTRLKLVDKRYASGLLGRELDEIKSRNKNAAENNASPQDIAQSERINFWNSILKESEELVSDDDHILIEHPRIQAGADHIDSILFDNNGDLTTEKMLVFGVFTKPLRALRNVVNFRYILRQLDKGLPVRAPKEDNPDYKILYEEYIRVKNKKQHHLHFKNVLNHDLNHGEFYKILNQARLDYDNVSKALNDFFNKNTNAKEGDVEFFEKLPGNDSLRKLKDIGKLGDFYEFIEEYILNEILQNNEFYSLYKQDGKTRSDKIIEISIQVWSSFLLAEHDISEEEEDEEKEATLTEIEQRTEWKESKNERHAHADLVGDKLTIEQLQKIISYEDNNQTTNRSNFCRYMSGDTDMKTRRALQLQFNHLNGMPKVLIAQSMVGREGLNLHEACRHVFLFHPEWNPAVVEQQIGRVDRINSRWESLVKEYYAKRDTEQIEFPYIEVDFLVFEGTYDEYQFARMKYRRENMAAQLFGALLPEECLEKVPEDMKPRLAEAAPDFSPFK